MCGSGAMIGTGVIVMVQWLILQVLQAARAAFSGAAVGATMRSTCGAPTATTTTRTMRTAMSVFASPSPLNSLSASFVLLACEAAKAKRNEAVSVMLLFPSAARVENFQKRDSADASVPQFQNWHCRDIEWTTELVSPSKYDNFHWQTIRFGGCRELFLFPCRIWRLDSWNQIRPGGSRRLCKNPRRATIPSIQRVARIPCESGKRAGGAAIRAARTAFSGAAVGTTMR